MYVFSKITVIIVIGFFIGAIIGPNILGENETSLIKTIYVDDDNTGGPWDGSQAHPYQYIQDGVDAATSGDTVYVYSGIYNNYDYININKGITLQGENKDNTYIGGYCTIFADHVEVNGFTIDSYYSTDYVEINRFTVNANYRYFGGGIYIQYSSYVLVSDNIIKNFEVGISLYDDVYYCEIFNNIIEFNSEFGIDIPYTVENNEIYNNIITDNFIGINSGAGSNSNNNHIYHNNFINNNINAEDGGINTWDNGYPSGGNYWDDYAGSDGDGDGIGDTTYPIPGGSNQDNYPLMNPWSGGNQPDLELFIEDSHTNWDLIKAPGDRVDIIFDVFNDDTENLESFDLDLNISHVLTTGNSYMQLVKCFIRNSFSDITNEIDITSYCNHDPDSNKFSVSTDDIPGWSGIPPDDHRQFVFRVEIPEDAVHYQHNHMAHGTVTSSGGSDSDTKSYLVWSGLADCIIVTNRHLLFSKYGDDSGGSNRDVETLLKYLFEGSCSPMDGWKSCIIYYVDHYNDTVSENLTDWDQDIDYTNETTANAVADQIDDLIETWVEKSNPDYLLIIGGDEIIPFYRHNDSNYANNEAEHPENSNDPVLNTIDENYFLSDSPYADTIGNDYDRGNIELSIGRIVGHSANNLKHFIELGINGPRDLENGLVASRSENHSVGDIMDALDIKNATIIGNINPDLTENDAWTENDLRNAMRQGFQTFTYLGHGGYDGIYGTNNWANVVVLHADELDDVNSNNCISDNNSLFVFHSCKIGVVSDEDGPTWNPEWDDCMLYSLVDQDCSGVVAAGGLAYTDTSTGVGGGELLVNDYMSHLITNSRESMEFGKALTEAKISYNPGTSWAGTDRKTVTEFIYFGVPWSTIDPPVSIKQEVNSSFSVEISDPIQIFDNQYNRTIWINVSDYYVSNEEGFDIIIINGSRLISNVNEPLIPFAEIGFKLPYNTTQIGINLVSNNSEFIGYYNIPLSTIAFDSENSIYDKNIHGHLESIYPDPIFYFEEDTLNIYKEVTLNVALIQYYFDTNETFICNSAKLEFTYNMFNPLNINNFQINNSFVIGEPVNGLVTLENVGSDTASDLCLNMSLNDRYSNFSIYNISTLFDISSGESIIVPIVIDELIPLGGMFDVKVDVINSTGMIVASTQEDIYISSGEILEFDCPEDSYCGDTVNFSILFCNNNISTVSAVGVIELYDSYNRLNEVLTSSPIIISPETSEYINISWDSTGFKSDIYTVSTFVNTSDVIYRATSEILNLNIVSYFSQSIGWNLITIPVNNDISMASQLAENITGCLTVSKWDNVAQTYHGYIVGGPPAFDFSIHPGMGLFVEVSEYSTLSLTGTIPSPVSIDLEIPWNMIGWYDYESTMASSLAENITGCLTVNKWDNVNQTYHGYIVGGPPAFDFEITQGMGLFVEVDIESTWHGEG